MVMTSLAEAIVTERGTFIHNKFMLKNEIGLNRYEKQILRKLIIGDKSRFHLSDYHKWISHLMKECLAERYLKKSLIMGTKPTKSFKKLLTTKLTGFNPSIVSYIETKNIGFLQKIDKDLRKVLLPDFRRTENALPDLADIAAEVIAKGYFGGF